MVEGRILAYGTSETSRIQGLEAKGLGSRPDVREGFGGGSGLAVMMNEFGLDWMGWDGMGVEWIGQVGLGWSRILQ